MARILAYALYYDDQIEFGRGISVADEPDLWSRDLTGQITHWIEVGAPSAERIHTATKKSPRVSILAHKGLAALSREMQKKKLHRAAEVELLLVSPSFIKEVTENLERKSEWTLVRTDDELSLTIDETNLFTTLEHAPLPQPGS